MNRSGRDAASPTRPDDPSSWTTLSTRSAFQNRWLGVEVDRVLLPNGREYEYTRTVPAAPGVGVVGFDKRGRILLEREYRHGVGEVIWQIPGGLADPGEPWQTAGLRELREETGYAPSRIDSQTVRYLGTVWDNPAFGPACSHVFAAWGLAPVAGRRRDQAEEVTFHWVEPVWLREAVLGGEIRDRVVIAAVGWLVLREWM